MITLRYLTMCFVLSVKQRTLVVLPLGVARLDLHGKLKFEILRYFKNDF